MPITNAGYRKAIKATLANPKTNKAGIRQMLRKNKTVILSHSLAGIANEVPEVLEAAENYILGFQMTPEMCERVEDELGDLLYFTHLGAQQLGVKVPAATKKVKPKNTPTALFLRCNAINARLTSLHKKVYYGLELDLEKIKAQYEELVLVTHELSWAFLNKAPAEVMVSNVQKLKERFPDGTFDVASILKKDGTEAKLKTAPAKKTIKIGGKKAEAEASEQ